MNIECRVYDDVVVELKSGEKKTYTDVDILEITKEAILLFQVKKTRVIPSDNVKTLELKILGKDYNTKLKLEGYVD